jgi:hypothetical protein
MLPLSDITLVFPFDTINSIVTLGNLSHCQVRPCIVVLASKYGNGTGR